MKFKKAVFFFLILLASSTRVTGQICSNYKLVPDTIYINVSDTFEIQEVTGGSTPPTLWVCNWINFGCNGTHECDSTTNCINYFTTAGLNPVCYEINEPFLNNTEVCTTWVYVNDCSAPALSAKANNTTDSVYVCSGAQIILTANPTSGFSCPGNWEYSWYNGSTYYDGNDFLSFTPVWSSNFVTAQYDDMVSQKNFTVKARCSIFPDCISTSTVFVKVAPTVQTPVFINPPAPTRCQKADTLILTAIASNADHIIYTLDNNSLSAGNTIDGVNGQLIFTPAYNGPTTITATATGCSGPKTTTLNLLTYPTPTLTINDDTSRTCLGDSLLLPLVLTGTSPFTLEFMDNDTSIHSYAALSPNADVMLFVDTSDILLTFYQLQDAHCTSHFDIKHRVLADSIPAYTPLTDTSLCEDASVILDLGAGNYQYLWLLDSSALYYSTIDTATAGIITGANNIYVQITNGFCTVTDTAVITFTICTSLPATEAESNLSVFPNPAHHTFYVSPAFNAKNIHIEIYTPAGTLVHEGDFDTGSGKNYPVSLNKAGLYIVKCTATGLPPCTSKIVVY